MVTHFNVPTSTWQKILRYYKDPTGIVLKLAKYSLIYLYHESQLKGKDAMFRNLCNSK